MVIVFGSVEMNIKSAEASRSLTIRLVFRVQ